MQCSDSNIARKKATHFLLLNGNTLWDSNFTLSYSSLLFNPWLHQVHCDRRCLLEGAAGDVLSSLHTVVSYLQVKSGNYMENWMSTLHCEKDRKESHFILSSHFARWQWTLIYFLLYNTFILLCKEDFGGESG